VDEKYIGSIYGISSFLSIISLLYISKILRRFGNYKTLLFLTILEFLSFLGLAFLENALFIIPIFIGYSIIFPMILFNFDVFLENYTKNENEGEVRGTFLTVVNTALILAPLLAGYILSDGNYSKIYLTSALLLIPFFFLILKFRNFEDPEYHDLKIISTLTCIASRKNLFNIFMAQFIMRFFFSWMVIYMPIYLHAHLGFTWPEIGIMTAIMLLPFALVEYPAGRLADKVLGEKELLIVGFVIAGLGTGLLSFIEISDFVFWTSLLFLVRVGASLIEIMTEVYFFKHVNESDSNTIGFFRITRPVAYIVGPLVGSVALILIDFQMIWIILGLITLSGIFFTSKIEDTR